MGKKFYVTTPIYYVNDEPHIGHACTTAVADIIARYHSFLFEEVFLLTGTDEHGAKVAEEAKKVGLEPKKFCDKVSLNFQDIWRELNIVSYFIRTTDPEHENIVQEFIQKIYDNGDIYKGKYEGLYCIGCEKFVTETDLIEGKCPLHPNREIQKQSEENYFFKLSKYVPILIRAIEDENDPNHYKISPPAKKEEVLSKLKTGVADLSISRANVSWGIPIPWDKTQTIYVWFDALLNYYSALKIYRKEEFWPPDLHIIGKEILWFHAVIWEAMLLSAGISLPKEVFAHSFYTIDNQKMSKSLGNVISPQQLIDRFGVDGTRYLIASSFPTENDSNAGWDKFIKKYNADLANGLGNLVARVAKLCEKSGFGNKAEERTTYFIETLNKTSGLKQLLDELRLGEALTLIWEKISAADKYIDKNQPWKLQREKLKQVLSYLVSEIFTIAWLIAPFMPETSDNILEQFADLVYFTEKKIKSGPPLFPRIT